MPDFFFPQLPAAYEQNEDGVAFSKDEIYKTYASTMRQWLLAAREEALLDAKQDEDTQNQQRYISYILGKQWKKMASYRATPVDNRVWGLVWELVSLLTDLRPVGQVKSIGEQNFENSEMMLNQATKSWWLETDADQQLALLIIYAILGTGFVKLQWNPTLRNGSGEFEIVPISPLNCLCLKPSDINLQSSQAVIYEQVWPLGKFVQKFGARGATVKADPSLSKYTVPGRAPSTMSAEKYSMLTPAAQALVGGVKDKEVPSSFPQARYREFWFRDYTFNTGLKSVMMGEAGTNWSYWVKPGEMLYPRGRVVMMGGEDVILRDGPNPYWHGQYPFDVLRLNIVPWQFAGLSDLRPLLPLQDVINNVLAGVIEMVRKAINPPLIGPRNAFSESTWNSIDTAKPNLKLAVSPLAGQAMPQFQPPPNLPSYVMLFMQMAARRMDQSSGIAAVSEAVQKRQVPSAETLEEVKEVQQTPIRLKGRNIEVLLRNIGTMNIPNIFQFYGPRRLMYLSGKVGYKSEFEKAVWDPSSIIPVGSTAENHARQFIYRIHPGSLLNINHVEKTMTIMRLRMMKDISIEKMYEVLDLGININEVKEELRQEALRQAETLSLQRAVMMLQQVPGVAQALAGLIPGGKAA